MNNKGLCFRCEWRAQFLESKRQPRFECGMIESAVMGCYMFQPVKPICIKPREGDNRPLSLNILSCRVERSDNEPTVQLSATQNEKDTLIYWTPYK